MDNSKFKWLQSKCEETCEPGVCTAASTTYNNLKNTKKWFEVNLHFDENMRRPYLVVKYLEDSLNRIFLPMYVEEALSMEDLLSVFHLLRPPGDPDSYEDGLVLALVSGDSSIVYHNVCPGLVPPNIKPTIGSNAAGNG